MRILVGNESLVREFKGVHSTPKTHLNLHSIN